MEIEVKNISVLVVDDNEMNVELLADILQHVNYTTYTALSGEEALALATYHNPEIILLDISMPEMDGYEVCRRIKKNPDTKEIPVIFISALDETADVVAGFDAGAVDYITKPFKYREVLARVQTQVNLLRHKRELIQVRQRERQNYENMDALRRQFIGSATHDLKNPLFVISGYADMLKMSPIISDNSQLFGHVQSIQRGVDKMSDLVHDILDLLQLETEVNLTKTSVNFTELLQQIFTDFVMYANEKQIKLTLYPPDESISIKVDVQRISRLLDNLISNAIKYTPENGEVDIVGKVGHQTVVIDIIDTGLGIPAEGIETIFQPFERVNTEEHMAQEGTGLGLSIVKTIVEQHSGTVEVASAIGEGSRFTVILPIA